MSDERITTEERQSRTASESAMLANRNRQESDAQAPERISVNPTVAARHPISDRRIGDVEYRRADLLASSSDSARRAATDAAREVRQLFKDQFVIPTENEIIKIIERHLAAVSVRQAPEALKRASKLCRSVIPGARVELIFQNLQDAQAVHKWLVTLAAAPADNPDLLSKLIKALSDTALFHHALANHAGDWKECEWRVCRDNAELVKQAGSASGAPENLWDITRTDLL